jgi:hypothetical protein
MGEYTEFVAGFNLKRATPPEVRALLSFMFSAEAGSAAARDPEPLPDHALFGETRWRSMFRSGSSSFDGLTICGISQTGFTYEYEVAIRCNFQCLDDEIDLLFDWLRPHMKTEGFVGYERGSHELPTLLFVNAAGELYKKALKEYLSLLCPRCRKKGLWHDAEADVVRCDECGADEAALNELLQKG